MQSATPWRSRSQIESLEFSFRGCRNSCERRFAARYEKRYAAKRSTSSNFSADGILVGKFHVRALALIYSIANAIQTFALS
jgi:hypothetical protein